MIISVEKIVGFYCEKVHNKSLPSLKTLCATNGINLIDGHKYTKQKLVEVLMLSRA